MARPRQITDEEILQSVRRAVLDEGPRVSLDLVAERLGVTTPALFKRFHSRSAMLTAALSPTRPAFLDRLSAGPDERPFAAQLTELFEEMARWFGDAVPCMVALKNCGASYEDVHAALDKASPVMLAQSLASWLEKADGAGLAVVDDPETASVAMLGALQTRSFLSHLLRRPTPPKAILEDARRLCALFLTGLQPRPARKAASTPRSRTSPRTHRTTG